MRAEQHRDRDENHACFRERGEESETDDQRRRAGWRVSRLRRQHPGRRPGDREDAAGDELRLIERERRSFSGDAETCGKRVVREESRDDADGVPAENATGSGLRLVSAGGEDVRRRPETREDERLARDDCEDARDCEECASVECLRCDPGHGVASEEVSEMGVRSGWRGVGSP